MYPQLRSVRATSENGRREANLHYFNMLFQKLMIVRLVENMIQM